MSKVAACIGAHPGIAFGVSALITIAISMIALVVGEFEVSADNAGWESRTTTMANRQVQFRALQECYTLNKDCWAGTLGTPSRRLHTPNMPENAEATATVTVPKPSTLRKRRLSNTEPSTSECRNAHANWNDPTIVYRAKDTATNLLSPAHFQQVCELEGRVLAASGYNGACRAGEGSGCALVNEGACLAPLSLVSSLRSATRGGWSLSCAELVADPAVLQGPGIRGRRWARKINSQYSEL